MADPFVAEIRIFPFNFAPKGWAWCDGQLLPISQNTALFSLLGTTYGGDGKSTFALPDLQGRAAMHPDQGPGLSLHDLGETGGTDAVQLIDSEMPAHSHAMQCGGNFATGNTNVAAGNSFAKSSNGNAYAPAQNLGAQLDFHALTPAGSGFPHNNLMPFVTFYFNIAMQGVFPPRP